ncbi:Uncharacterised protein [Salmonella enterica subsp. arizonae]|uniref:Uncharacterized protein n=1 Tax=Salmonella enterica subsp. arizonae TaxID=59203 RepID=A0A379TKQ8_SALER|nr:Uncharacterised protein [Salmonella enterica subsp. arizonae]
MTNMDSKKLKRCAQIILFFYGASFLLTFLIGISNLIPPYIYIIFFTPFFVAYCGFSIYLGRKKVFKSLNDSILFSFAPIAMFKPVKILLFKAENINETISNSDKILMYLYLLIAVCSIIKALISLNELYDNLKKPEKK